MKIYNGFFKKKGENKMARYKDEQCRRCRREGQKLFLKGDRCYSDKCSVSRRNLDKKEQNFLNMVHS